MEKNTKTISNSTCFAYGIGGLGEGIGYNFFFGFFLFFLTNTAGVSPAWAGTISMIAVFWDAISDPLIGFMSDHSKNPKGRRRPFLFKGSILLGIAVFLLFNNFDISPTLKVLYYIAINILYWIALTSCVIPHTSLGAELTNDFNQRTSIRAYQTFFMNIGAGMALSGTLVIVGFFSKYFGDSGSWAATGAVFGIIVFLAYFTCYLCTRGKEPENINLQKEKTDQKQSRSFLSTYKGILGNKALRYVLVIDFAVNFMLGIAVSVRVYLYTYTFGFSDAMTSLLMMIYSIVIIVGVILSNYIAKKLGKKTAMVVGTLVYAAGFLIVYFLPDSQIIVGTGLVMEGLGNCTFWTLLYSFAYDTSIIEVYKYGEGNEGIIVSMIGLFMKVGNAIGMWLCGLGLAYIGFNAELAVQSVSTQNGLKVLYCLVSAAVLIIGAIVFSRYPLTEEKYEQIREMAENPELSHDTTGLEKLL